MIRIISGTNRSQSRSLAVSEILLNLYQKLGVNAEILSLDQISFSDLAGGNYSGPHSEDIQSYLNKIETSRGLVVVAPEYNGSMPGALKLFIDHWTFPASFEFRPVAFVGLGGRFGGLRPVEHLQQIFGYRNAFIYPERVFLINVWNILKENKIECDETYSLMQTQASGFVNFLSALESQKMTPYSKDNV